MKILSPGSGRLGRLDAPRPGRSSHFVPPQPRPTRLDAVRDSRGNPSAIQRLLRFSLAARANAVVCARTPSSSRFDRLVDVG